MQFEWLIQFASNAFYVILGAVIVLSYDVYKNWKLKKQVRKALRAELTQARDTLREEVLRKAREDSPVHQLHFEGPFYERFPLNTTFYDALSHLIHSSLKVKELASLEGTYNIIRHFNAAYFRKLLTDQGLFVTVHVQPVKALVHQIEATLAVLG